MLRTRGIGLKQKSAEPITPWEALQEASKLRDRQEILNKAVFMYLMAMCNILFEWIKIILVKNKTPNINLKMRVKAVCFRYITVATTFVNHAREKVLQVFSDQEYKILQI